MDRRRNGRLRLGLIGNGAIARQISAYCAERTDRFEIVGALVRAGDTARAMPFPLIQDLSTLIAFGPVLVVECAGHDAVASYGATLLAEGIDLVVVSVGSLGKEELLASLQEAARTGGGQLITPEGALPGVDSLAAAALAGLNHVVLRSSKPPLAWAGTPAADQFDLAAIKSATVIFEGDAREAVRLYPKNANVAATVALAGVGFELTHVILTADPGIRHNVHHLEAQGAFGQMVLEIEAKASPDNPKTSLMAALSVMRLLERRAQGLVI